METQKLRAVVVRSFLSLVLFGRMVRNTAVRHRNRPNLHDIYMACTFAYAIYIWRVLRSLYVFITH